MKPSTFWDRTWDFICGFFIAIAINLFFVILAFGIGSMIFPIWTPGCTVSPNNWCALTDLEFNLALGALFLYLFLTLAGTITLWQIWRRFYLLRPFLVVTIAFTLIITDLVFFQYLGPVNFSDLYPIPH